MNGLRIAKGTRATIQARLTSVDGAVLEDGIVAYVHGSGRLLPGVEAILEGLAMGEERSGVLKAGEVLRGNQEPTRAMPRSAFPRGVGIEAGEQFAAREPNGKDVVLRILSATNETVSVQLVHPLEGKDIEYELKVLSVMPPLPEAATSEGAAAAPTRICPACAEEILGVAKKCKHCGEWSEPVDRGRASASAILDKTRGKATPVPGMVDVARAASHSSESPEPPPRSSLKRVGYLLAGVGAAVLTIVVVVRTLRGPNPMPHGFEDFELRMSSAEFAAALMDQQQLRSDFTIHVPVSVMESMIIQPPASRDELAAKIEHIHGLLRKAELEASSYVKTSFDVVVTFGDFRSYSASGPAAEFSKVRFTFEDKWDGRAGDRYRKVIGTHLANIHFYTWDNSLSKYRELVEAGEELIGEPCEEEDDSGRLCSEFRSCDWELCGRDLRYQVSRMTCGADGTSVSIALYDWKDACSTSK